MSCHLMHSSSLRVDAELEKDLFKVPEMRRLDDTYKFTSKALCQMSRVRRAAKVVRVMCVVMGTRGLEFVGIHCKSTTQLLFHSSLDY